MALFLGAYTLRVRNEISSEGHNADRGKKRSPAYEEYPFRVKDKCLSHIHGIPPNHGGSRSSAEPNLDPPSAKLKLPTTAPSPTPYSSGAED
jgi:hypothetical protein